MSYQSPRFDLASIFEQREKEIEAERRSAKDKLAIDSTPDERILHHVIEEAGRPSYILEMQGRKFLRSLTPDSPEGMRILSELQQANVSVINLETIAAELEVNVDPLLTHIQELAAVSGRVEPNDLIPENTEDETRRSLLSRLAPQCSIETHEGKVQWLLSATYRNDILRHLNESGRLNEVLAGPLPTTDRFGQILRTLLKEGSNLSFTTLQRDDLLALIAVIDAIDESGLPYPDVTQVRNVLGREEFLSEYEVLLARGFVGRTQELEELRSFLDAPIKEYTWSSLIITGFGGAGKSTLLAKFAREVFAQKLATIVILDFDRPGIDAKDFYWLEQEISRQVGRQYPEGEDLLRQRRREERRYRAEYTDSISQQSSEGPEALRSSHSIMYDVRRVLDRAGMVTRPFLLVLDTYEQIEEDDLSERVFDWCYDLTSALGPAPLKVIFSGRLYDSSRATLQKHSDTKLLEIGDLTQSEALELLQNNGIPAPMAERLAFSELLPRRPLELTLLARITTDLDKTVGELEEELREGGDSAKELFAGLVYRRVLRRLPDPTAQQLAYPGLVLRYVTVDLIRNVLGPALNLPQFGEAEASEALEALASCSWLVSRQNDEVWHRADLRSSTLKAMIATEPVTAEKISRAAVKFFESKSDERSLAEAVYHRLMLMKTPEDGELFELTELKKANVFIKSSVGDLPPVAATLLKFAVEGKVPNTEVESLPKIYLDSAYSQAGSQLVLSRLFGKALKLYERRNQTSSTTPLAALKDWELETLFATASWDRLKLPEKIKTQFRVDPVQRVTREIYPAQIIAPEIVSNYELGSALERATQREPDLEASLLRSEGQETLRRLVVSLIYETARDNWDHDIRKVVERISNYRRKFTTQPIAPVTERRLMFLERILNGNSHSEVTFSINTLRLDLKWIGAFGQYIKRNHEDATNPGDLNDLLREIAEKMTCWPGRTVRTVLGEIDSLSKAAGVQRGTKLVVTTDNTTGDEAVKYLRGPSPEFRDPCRFALLEAFPDRSSLYKLGDIIYSLTEIHAQDVNPASFANTLAADPEHALVIYVEIIDRAWALGDLMHSAANKAAASSKVNKVYSAFMKWDNALTTTITKGCRSHS